MVVIDTNVVSELMRASASRDVVEWLDSQETRDLFVTSVTEAEIRAGLAVLPEGARRRGLVDLRIGSSAASAVLVALQQDARAGLPPRPPCA